MIYYDKEKYTPKPFGEDLIHELEEQYHIKCLFGAVYSSKSSGIDNVESDLDFKLFFMGEKASFRILHNELDFFLLITMTSKIRF